MAKKEDFLDYHKNKWILHHCQEFLHIFLNSFPEPWKKFPIQLLDAKDWKGANCLWQIMIVKTNLPKTGIVNQNGAT